ncbi:MAG: RICIN domain-containing protein [Acidobacteriota bacterium]|nr:MAG: RICIN domain-containing protein [Acidobacteriota bacterium]
MRKFFVFCVVLMAFSVTGFAQGGFTGPGRYRIEVVASGKSLDLKQEDGRTVQQWSGADVVNQKWDFEDAGDGYVYIRSAGTGRVIEVADSRDGGAVRVNNFTGRDNQKWRLTDAGNGQFTIGSKLGRVMDLPNSSRDDGIAIQVWSDRRQPNQLFRLSRVEGAAPVQTVERPRRRRPGDRTFGRRQDPYMSGNVRWSGRVDIEVLLEIKGSTVTEKLVGGRSFNNGRYTFSAAMPAREMDVRINNIKVRGTVELVEKPMPSNNFTAIVRIKDPQRDAADYEFELIW